MDTTVSGSADALTAYQQTLADTQQYMNDMLGYQSKLRKMQTEFNAQSDKNAILNSLSNKLSSFVQQVAQGIR